jgi:flagellum-specific peptidoglycan hydrolase FlgJ
MTPDAFIAVIGPAARTSAAVSKIPASFTVAEAALESGWGVHAPGMNLFGIKADASWQGASMTERTDEIVNGSRITISAHFRAYPTWLASIEDHATFLLTNPRYKGAFAYVSGATFAMAIAAAGYATDPNYAAKIISIIKTHNLSTLDT